LHPNGVVVFVASPTHDDWHVVALGSSVSLTLNKNSTQTAAFFLEPPSAWQSDTSQVQLHVIHLNLVALCTRPFTVHLGCHDM
jgi:hypothetical protein